MVPRPLRVIKCAFNVHAMAIKQIICNPATESFRNLLPTNSGGDLVLTPIPMCVLLLLLLGTTLGCLSLFARNPSRFESSVTDFDLRVGFALGWVLWGRRLKTFTALACVSALKCKYGSLFPMPCHSFAKFPVCPWPTHRHKNVSTHTLVELTYAQSPWDNFRFTRNYILVNNFRKLP